MKTLQRSKSHIPFELIYDIFDGIADANDIDAMTFAVKEKFHNFQNRDYKDIFYVSCKKLNFKLTHLLLEASKDCINRIVELPENTYAYNSEIFYKLPRIFSSYTLNIANLNYISGNKDLEISKLLFTIPGMDINAKDQENKTALIKASMSGYHEAVKLLLTVPGIDVNLRDEKKGTALIWA